VTENAFLQQAKGFPSFPFMVPSACTWLLLFLTRRRLPEPDTLDFYVDPSDGHDDFLSSLALLVEAVTAVASLPAISVCIPPRPMFVDEGPF
jgi:hypothetical protein